MICPRSTGSTVVAFLGEALREGDVCWEFNPNLFIFGDSTSLFRSDGIKVWLIGAKGPRIGKVPKISRGWLASKTRGLKFIAAAVLTRGPFLAVKDAGAKFADLFTDFRFDLPVVLILIIFRLRVRFCLGLGRLLPSIGPISTQSSLLPLSIIWWRKVLKPPSFILALSACIKSVSRLCPIISLFLGLGTESLGVN